MFATRVIRFGYQQILKPVLFKLDPEDVHDRFCWLGELFGKNIAIRRLTRGVFCFKHASLSQEIHGIHFSNPIGLAAGFDKNARLARILPNIGFGFEEVGSITGEPCEGNPRPRLWRLPKSKGLLVNYGLKNDGCLAIASRLEREVFEIPIGISIAKTNAPSTVDIEAGIADYVKAFRAFLSIGHYFTINISCPNAFGGEPFTNPARLDRLLTALDAIPTTKPIFVKMPCDLSTEELDVLIAVIDRHRVHGLILGNLSKRYDAPTIQAGEMDGKQAGGISGKPTFESSNRLIAHLYRTTKDRYVIVGCGGVFSAEDAYEKIRQGASLVQLITGMIFEGPQVIGEINRGLVALLQRDGFHSIQEAIGSAHR